MLQTSNATGIFFFRNVSSDDIVNPLFFPVQEFAENGVFIFEIKSKIAIFIIIPEFLHFVFLINFPAQSSNYYKATTKLAEQGGNFVFPGFSVVKNCGVEKLLDCFEFLVLYFMIFLVTIVWKLFLQDIAVNGEMSRCQMLSKKK